MNIDCLIPAAGFSSRMGSWKLMLPYKQSTIVEQTVSNALSHCSRVILVTGHRGEELEKLYRGNKRVVPVRNHNFKQGMFSSIQTGTSLIQTDWFFITMGDMPGISPALYEILIKAQTANRGIEIIRPLFKGKRGHPVLLKRNVIPTILSEPPGSKMKNVFTHHHVLDIEMNRAETFNDIDTKEDYREATGKLK